MSISDRPYKQARQAAGPIGCPESEDGMFCQCDPYRHTRRATREKEQGR